MKKYDREYFIFCDESITKGDLYSNFYGGILIDSQHYERFNEELIALKKDLNLFEEIKWQKVTSNYLDKYKKIVDVIFKNLEEDKIKIRIFFRHNKHTKKDLKKYQIEEEYLFCIISL
jgi:hypothetical protein